MTRHGKKPPRFAEKLLAALANRRSHAAIIGDLEEEYSFTAESRGEMHAILWYWKLIIISLPSFVMNRLIWSWTMFRNYFKIAFRNIWRSKLFAAINLLGLAVGMSCFILISLWVKDELSFDTFHKHGDELYLLTIEHPNGALDYNVPYALAPRLAMDFPEILHYTRNYTLGTQTCSFSHLTESGTKLMFYEESVSLVDRPFFEMFSFDFVEGDPAAALENPNSLVIRERVARKYFGDDSALGKKLTFNNRRDMIITGVVRIPDNSHLQLDFISPLESDLADDWNWRDQSFVRLDPQASPDALREKISGTMNAHFPNLPPGDFSVGMMPLTEVHLGFGRKTYVYIFSVIAVFILLIACINYMNLSTASSSGRAREVALRKVVGAGRGQLIYQFLGESILMAALAFGFSLALVKLMLPLINRLTAKNLALSSGLTGGFFILLAGLVLGVGIIAGSYPALFLTASKPVETLRAALKFRSNRSVFRVVSVVGQFAISVLLIVCTLVVMRQLNFLQSRPLGLSTDYVISIRSNPSLQRRFLSFKRELLQNPNIISVTRGQQAPFNEDYKTSGVEWAGKDPELVPMFRYSITDFDLIETFGMEIVEGRSFSSDRPADRANFIINQAAVRYMGLEDPVGQPLSFWGNQGQIIGVVKDFHHVSLHREILPQIFTINPGFYSNWIKYIFVKISPNDLQGTLGFIEETSLRLVPDFPFESVFLDRGVQALYDAERRLGKIFTYFAFLAVFISCLGILGLSAFTAEQRTKEIGIRKVLGSSASGIALLLSRQFSRWILTANVIAWPVAYYVMHQWLKDFAYRTGLNLLLFLLAGLLALLIAAIPIGYQALKAAGRNPVEALRYE